MSTLLTYLQNVAAFGFVVLGLVATAEWIRRRGSARFYQAAAIDLLAMVSVISRIEATSGTSTPLTDLVLVSFMGSGYLLLLFRDVFLPMNRLVRHGVGVACLSVTGIALIVPLPDASATPTVLQSTLISALLLIWIVCVAEPTARFWLAARGRTVVQRARLRALTLGYADIVVVVGIAATVGPLLDNIAARIAIEILVLASIPLLWVAFSPPLWVRQLWRSSEEDALRHSMQDLLLFTPDRRVLAERALDWATRLFGGAAAYIAEADGSVIASKNMDDEQIAAVHAKIRDVGKSSTVAIDAQTTAITVPIKADGVDNRIVLLSGPFTPVFGTDEVALLESYATAVSLGLERARLTERLASVERAKTAFLNLASHELRGPLTVIRGYVTMIADGDFGRFPVLEKSVIPALVRQAEQMSLLVEQMIETARLEDDRLELHFEELDLAALLTAVVDETKSLLPADAVLTLEPGPTTVMVNGDRERVRTIVTNIIDNAVKYSPAGVRVSCGLRIDNGTAFVDVSDRGVGIPADQAHRLFTRFGRIVTPDNAHIAGTGLGLYLCRELARRQQGDIVAQPREGGGTRFTFSLPALATPEAEPPSEPSVALPEPAASSGDAAQ